MGGSAAILRRSDGVERELSSWTPDTTNNRAELTAALLALEYVPDRRRMIMHVDSEYVQNNATKNLPLWKLNDWKTTKKKAVVNRDLWERLDAASSKHEVVWRWVGAHGDDDMNNRADALATKAREDQAGKPDKVSVRRISSGDQP